MNLCLALVISAQLDVAAINCEQVASSF
ncbi:MAG: hypothetical protein ACI80S_001891, partial [Pseudohongiellaceae bacterium]